MRIRLVYVFPFGPYRRGLIVYKHFIQVKPTVTIILYRKRYLQILNHVLIVPLYFKYQSNFSRVYNGRGIIWDFSDCPSLIYLWVIVYLVTFCEILINLNVSRRDIGAKSRNIWTSIRRETEIRRRTFIRGTVPAVIIRFYKHVEMR